MKNKILWFNFVTLFVLLVGGLFTKQLIGLCLGFAYGMIFTILNLNIDKIQLLKRLMGIPKKKK